MAKKRLAVPSNAPGGLTGSRSDHFGHCDIFTLVDIENNEVVAVNTVPNVEHGAGGCMVPVGMLKEQGVDAIIVGGMGARPLQGFSDVGIEVYFAARDAFAGVQDAVRGMLANELLLMQPTQACRGNANCHG